MGVMGSKAAGNYMKPSFLMQAWRRDSLTTFFESREAGDLLSTQTCGDVQNSKPCLLSLGVRFMDRIRGNGSERTQYYNLTNRSEGSLKNDARLFRSFSACKDNITCTNNEMVQCDPLLEMQNPQTSSARAPCRAPAAGHRQAPCKVMREPSACHSHALIKLPNQGTPSLPCGATTVQDSIALQALRYKLSSSLKCIPTS